MSTSWPALRTFISVLGGALTLGSVAAAQTPSSVWTIPGTVNAGGLNNTRFISDLAVTNPGLAPVTATLTLVPANGTGAASVTLNPGETVVYRNVLDRLWGAQGAGATQVASDAPLLIRARTYNTATSGTYGVALPVFADDRLLSERDLTHSLWISQSADGTSGYRTNVAVVFPDAGGGSATVSVYDADGNVAGTQDFSLNTPGFQQFSVSSFAGAVPVGRAQIQVTGGRAAGYSVVVDNVTGDSSLFAFEDLPAGHQDVLVNGVARSNGRNSTFFRTDCRFFNPGTADATVSVAFHDNQNSNPSPLTRTFTVPAGKIRDVVDVLDSLLGLPVGSAGALRFRSDAPVAILCRTSNVDPLGVKPGTYGAQQKPTQLLSFLMSADAGAVVTGIRQNAAFRTNVGFAAGPDGSSYSLTLKSTSGATVATATGSLGTFGWTQPNVQDLFPSAAIPEDATLLVKVTSGSVDVFDSSIDNASGDPVVTPIMPLPVDIPSSATIGPLGGSIRSTDGRVTLKIPAGALSSGVALSFVETTNGAPQGQGSAYRLSPGDLAFAVPAQLIFRYALADAEGGGPDSLGLAFSSGATWYVVTGGVVNAAGRTLIVPIASTTPSIPASARTAPARRGLVNAFQEWGPFLARDLTPKFSATVEDAKVTFSVAVTGYSSSDLNVPLVVALGLPVNPASLIYTWYANDTFDGDADAGTIEEFQNVARYKAAHCAPHRNPVQIRVDIINPAGTGIYGIADRVTLRAWIKVLPRHWEISADMSQYTTCQDSSDHAQRQEWKDVKYSFDISETVTDSPDGPILTFVNPSSPGGVAGKTTSFSVCAPDTCSYVLETPQTLAFSDLGGSYNVRAETLTLIVGLGGLQVVLFPGWTATCPAPPGPPNVHKFDAFGSTLLPYFSAFNRLVEPGFVILYERITPVGDIGGTSLTARIYGVPCQ
jgi:hypothetical protein